LPAAGRSVSLVDVLEPSVRRALERAAAGAFETLPVLAAYVFGSRVAGTPRPDSDLDIGYYLDGYRRGERLSLGEEMRLAARLSAAAGLAVDLRNLGEAPLELRGRVLEEGVRIYSGDAAARVALERELLARYHDCKDAFRRMHAIRLRAVAERGL
jgi:predicted nucleotidyltransferase